MWCICGRVFTLNFARKYGWTQRMEMDDFDLLYRPGLHGLKQYFRRAIRQNVCSQRYSVPEECALHSPEVPFSCLCYTLKEAGCLLLSVEDGKCFLCTLSPGGSTDVAPQGVVYILDHNAFLGKFSRKRKKCIFIRKI